MEVENSSRNNSLYEFGPFRLIVGERRLLRDGKPVALQRKVFDLLAILVAAPGHLKSRAELIETLWPDTIVEEQGLTIKLHALRKVLGDEGETPVYIETVRGVGYRFIAPVNTPYAVGETVATPTDSPSVAASPRRLRNLYFSAAVLLLAVIAAVLIWRFVPADASLPKTPSVAVLPFENLSANQHNAYFVVGVRDTILTHLTALDNLRVISRSSSQSYPSHPQDLRKVAAELGANAVLEGSVQMADDRVMINVQLIDAGTNAHLWAASYTRGLDHVFEVESDVATQVAAALDTKLQPEQLAQLKRSPTHDPQAYLYYLRANYLANQAFGRESAKNPGLAVSQATHLYRQAIEQDPKFALAWARLALLQIRAYWFDIGASQERIRAAQNAAKHAVEIAPALAQAHMAMGYVKYYGQLDYAAALEQFRRAKASLPHNAQILAAIAFIHRRQGKWQKALAGLRSASELDPRNPRWLDELGTTLAAMRRYQDAMQSFNRALALEPQNYDGLIRKIGIQLLQGDLKQARAALGDVLRGADPQGFFSSLRFELAWLARKPQQALAALNKAPAWMIGAGTLGELPKSLLEAKALELAGKSKQAKNSYHQAQTELRSQLRSRPQSPDLFAALAIAEVALGEANGAMRDAQRAVNLLPVSKDALAGPIYLAVLARVYARAGKGLKAVELLQRLLAMPAGRVLSVPLLRLDPAWDSLREMPAFKKLLKQYSTRSAQAVARTAY